MRTRGVISSPLLLRVGKDRSAQYIVPGIIIPEAEVNVYPFFNVNKGVARRATARVAPTIHVAGAADRSWYCRGDPRGRPSRHTLFNPYALNNGVSISSWPRPQLFARHPRFHSCSIVASRE